MILTDQNWYQQLASFVGKKYYLWRKHIPRLTKIKILPKTSLCKLRVPNWGKIQLSWSLKYNSIFQWTKKQNLHRHPMESCMLKWNYPMMKTLRGCQGKTWSAPHFLISPDQAKMWQVSSSHHRKAMLSHNNKLYVYYEPLCRTILQRSSNSS